MSPIHRAATLAAVYLFGAPLQGVYAQPYAVSLDVRSESWEAGGAFDRTDFTKQCATVGVTIGNAEHGLVAVDYKETKGSEYGTFGFGGGGFGTKISYTLTLLSARDAKTILSLKGESGTPGNVKSGANLHAEAVASFKGTSLYSLSCGKIAASLGSRQEAVKLLPPALGDREILDLLLKLRFTPASSREGAFLAVAEHKWEGLQQFGADAGEPLSIFIRNYLRDDSGLLLSSSKENADIGAAASALANTSDPGAAKVFEDLLKASDRVRRDSIKPIVIPTLRALGKVGTVFSLQAIEAWTSCKSCDSDKTQVAAGQEIALAAEEAARELRARLVAK